MAVLPILGTLDIEELFLDLQLQLSQVVLRTWKCQAEKGTVRTARDRVLFFEDLLLVLELRLDERL